MDRTELKEVKLYEEKGEYFLKIVYEEEDEKGIYKTTFPKVALDIPKTHYSMYTDTDEVYCDNRPYWSLPTYSFVNNRSQLLRLCCNNAFGYGIKLTETIKEKTQELTLEEIEEKLGYKVKIVSKKKGDK